VAQQTTTYFIPYTMKKNTIVTRLEKGTELTWTEMDNNLRTLKSLPNIFGYESSREYTGTNFETDTSLNYEQTIYIPIKENMDFYDLYSIGYSILFSVFRSSAFNDHNVFNI
jgi:hypothetical protein